MEGRLYKPAAVDFAGIAMVTTGGVQLATGIEYKRDNLDDSRAGQGRVRISARKTSATFQTPTFNEDVWALLVHGAKSVDQNRTTIKHNRTGLVDQGDLTILTADDSGAVITIVLPNAQNVSDLNSNLGNKGGEFAATFPMAFDGYWANDTEGDAYTIIDRTPTGAGVS
jgi:hypothetical protein